MDKQTVVAAFHFLDRTRIVLRWPRREGQDAATVASTVRQALDSNLLTFVIDGDLMVIPLQSVKYVHISPAPTAVPSTFIPGASVDQTWRDLSDD